MTYQIVYSEEAIVTFELISEQVKSRWGEKYLSEFERRVVKVLDIIKESPYLFPPAQLSEKIRRVVVHKTCSMIYEISQTHIEILFFLG